MAIAVYSFGVVFALPLPEKHHLVGNDISFPQCGKELPRGQAFGIVGVNGGVASNTNPCLAEQLRWAHTSTGESVGQVRSQLYVNTGNPHDSTISGWPDNNADPSGRITKNPHGICDGSVTRACAWQYGWNRAVEAVEQRFKPAARSAFVSDNPRSYMWWLDVETMNSWETGSTEGLANNTAVLEAMASYYKDRQIRLGIYSTSHQLGKIVGTLDRRSILHSLDSWLAGGENPTIAARKCGDSPLVRGGRVVMVQYIKDGFDFNYSCL